MAMNAYSEYRRGEGTNYDWHDVLSRRITNAVTRLHTLSVSCDGRVALGTTTHVSVLNPASVFRMSAPSQRSNVTDAKPIEYALMDSSYRIAQGIRPPVIGHEIVFESEEEVLADTRKYITSCRRDITNVAWAPADMDIALLIVDGEGSCFVAMPRYSSDGALVDGTWGGILALWHFKNVTPTGEHAARMDVGAASLSTGGNLASDPPIRDVEINVPSASVRPPNEVELSKKTGNVEMTDKQNRISSSQREGDIRDQPKSIKLQLPLTALAAATVGSRRAIRDNTGGRTQTNIGGGAEVGKGSADLNDSANQAIHSKPKAVDVSNQKQIGSDVLCASFCRIFKPILQGSQPYTDSDKDGTGPASDTQIGLGSRTYIVVGTKTGAHLYEYPGWKKAARLQTPIVTFTTSRSSVLSFVENVEYSTFAMTVVAIGGGMGDVAVYGMWYRDPSEAGELVVESALLWKVDDGLATGPVSGLAWNVRSGDDGGLQLAVAVGNNILLVEWNEASKVAGDDDILWEKPRAVHRIVDAHDHLVSAVEFCADGSIVSSSLDGNVCRWLLQNWEGDENGVHLVPYDVIQDSAQRAENAMAIQKTVNGFGMFVVSTATRSYREVGEKDDTMRTKYQSGSRRTLLSLFICAADDWDGVANRIVEAIEAHWRRDRIGQAVSLWDIELFMDGCEIQHGVVEALQSIFHSTFEKLRLRKANGRQVHEHCARVLLALCRVILCTEMVDEESRGAIEKARSELFNSLLAGHFETCLMNFIERGIDASNISDVESKSLESMCQYVSMVSEELLWNGGKVQESVKKVRKVLNSCDATRQASTITRCPVCGPEVNMPLVADAEEANAFYCSSGEYYTRCILTGLPCTDAVPVVCQGCDARAQKVGVNVGGEKAAFEWIQPAGVCPLCRCALLPSSVEMI